MGDAPNTFARARKWLAQRGRDQRFSLFLHTYEVHAPYLPRDARALATANALTPSDSREWDADRQWAMMHGHSTGTPLPVDEVPRLEALYRGEIEYIDRAFGELLAYNDDEKIAENTILVVFSDHGDEFSQQGQIGHGFSLGNEVLHVPLFFRWPGHIAAGADAAPAEVLDILPTLLELSGIESPPALGSASLRARMQDIPAAAAVDFAFSENVLADPSQYDSRSCALEAQTIQDGRWKLQRGRRAGRAWSHQLFDIMADPAEQQNVAATHVAEVLRLTREIERRTKARAALPRSDTAAARPALDETTRRRLKALGYVK